MAPSVLSGVSPVSASSGPSPFVDCSARWQAPSQKSRPPLHFPAPVGMTGWAQGSLGGVHFRKPLRVAPISPHRGCSAQGDSSQGCDMDLWAVAIQGVRSEGQEPHAENRL